MTTFESLHPVLQEILISELSWDSLRPVQEESINAISEGYDILVLAPTAGGKTEAAFLPVIDAILKHHTGKLSAVYISPLKALINDQTERVIRLCRRSGLEVAIQHGDITKTNRWDFSSEEKPDILLTTPESLEVLLGEKDASDTFSSLRFIIIDEIHAFIENSRGVHLRCLIDRLGFLSNENIIRIGLSATVGNPEYLLNWLSSPERKQKLVAIPSPPSKKLFSFIVESNFLKQADFIADAVRGKKALVFVDSRSFAEKLLTPLKEQLIRVFVHHSAISAEERKTAENSFEMDGGTCVICTSTMELGIDIGELDLVVQYGTPLSVASFLQRLGRTGRRGSPAQMVFILNNVCELLTSCATVESAMRHESESLMAQDFPCDVLVQQLFLYLKRSFGKGRNQIISYLQSLTPFSQINGETIEEILTFLEENAYLSRDGARYFPGTKTEIELGYSNWKNLLSVIPDTGGYLAVLPDGTVIGTLDSRFVAGDPGKIFSFTGKTWRLLHRDDTHRRALIEPTYANRGLKRPFWGGVGSGAEISELITRSTEHLIIRGKTLLPLHETERELLSDLICSLPKNFSPRKLHIRTEPEEDGWSVSVSTFAGERANKVLTLFLKNRLLPGLEYRTTPFAIRIWGFETSDAGNTVERVLSEVENTDISILADELPPLPDTVWKFAPLLPATIKKEMAIRDYYHLRDVLNLLH
ncbi:MAG TPA: DEAD/DEAH box helicase [Methanocorpusculum sp.]|nr:DEAD/DEAH box helicase [Methanocorpusculum sp.]